jgi:hypothetical protein
MEALIEERAAERINQLVAESANCSIEEQEDKGSALSRYDRVIATIGISLLLCGVPTGAHAEGPIVVPLHVEHGQFGEDRLGIDVSIGGAVVRVLFDTGSVGLRLRADALPAAAAHRTGRSAGGTFANGLILRGEEATANVAIGDSHDAADLNIELVDNYTCAFVSPFCSSTADAPPEMFGGLFPGILGVRNEVIPDGTCCANPLPELARAVGRRFVVHAKLDNPTLTLDPDPASVAAFTLIDVPTGTVPRGCIRIGAEPSGTVCGDVVFDTGSPQIIATTTTGETLPLPPARSAVSLTIGTWSHAIVVGGPDHVQVSVMRARSDRIVVGLAELQSVDVYYDLDAGRIGLLSR